MPERASVFQGVQLGVETTPGTAVAANRKLAATDIQLGIKAETKKFKPMGEKFNTITTLSKEWVEAEIKGVLTYTDFVYLMASAVAYAAPAQQGATIAYKWTAAPSPTAPDTRKTYTVEAGGTVRAHKSAHLDIETLGYNITRETCEVKGSGIAQRLTDNITMTASPTAVALQPVLGDTVCFYLDDTQGGLGTTKQLRTFKIDFDPTARIKPVWPIDCALTSFAATVETEFEGKLTVLMEADAQGMALLDTLRAGAKKFGRVIATGPTIATPYTYVWQHDLCLTVTDVKKFSDEDGVYAIEWEFGVTKDATWGKAFEYQVTNAISAL